MALCRIIRDRSPARTSRKAARYSCCGCRSRNSRCRRRWRQLSLNLLISITEFPPCLRFRTQISLLATPVTLIPMPEPLIHNSARVLEFDALRELLRGYASSPLGQAKSRRLRLRLIPPWIREQQELTAEVREFRRVGGRFDFSGLLDVTATDCEVPHHGSRARDHGYSRCACWWWIAPRSGARSSCILRRA